MKNREWAIALVALFASCTPAALAPVPGDASPDVRGDVVDASAADVVTADIVTADIVTPDVVTPDVVTPDVVTPDVVTPDVATPDVATPDVVDAGPSLDAGAADVVAADVVDAVSSVDASDAPAPTDVVALPDVVASPASVATGREGHAAVVLGDGRVLIAGGRLNGTTGYLDDVEIYDPTSNRWSSGPRLPARFTSPAAAVANGGRVYLFGGYNGSSSLGTTYVLEPGATVWRSTTAMPTARDGARGAVARDGRIFVIGGSATGTTLTSVEIFDVSTERWGSGPALQSARAFGGAATLPDGRIAAFGGYNTSGGGQFVNSVEILDLGTNRWTYGPPMPSTIGSAGGAALMASDGLVHLVGGNRAGTIVGTHAVFDPATNTYRNLAAVPAPRGLPGLVEAPRGTLLLVSGSDERGAGVANVYAYGLASDVWR